MDAKIMVLERRKDGRLYPLGGVLPVQERARAIRLAHRLVHADGLSIRQCQAAMMADFGVRRSRGMICRDLHDFACMVCDPGAFSG